MTARVFFASTQKLLGALLFRYMRPMRVIVALLPAAFLFAAPAPGQTGDEEGQGGWSSSASVYYYSVPDDENYAQPTISADRDWLHLEARYNYEDHDTGSIWAGYNFSGGDRLAWEFTPMFGGIFGDTDGIAPGFKGSLGWSRLEFYMESEYVFDSEDSSGNFLYNWSELTFAAADWIRFGLVAQRTRAHEADRDVERGVLVGLSYGSFYLTGYLLDPDESDPTLIVALGVDF